MAWKEEGWYYSSLVPDRTFHVPLGFFFANESLEKKVKRRRGSGMPAWRTDVAKSSRGEGRGGGGDRTSLGPNEKPKLCELFGYGGAPPLPPRLLMSCPNSWPLAIPLRHRHSISRVGTAPRFPWTETSPQSVLCAFISFQLIEANNKRVYTFRLLNLAILGVWYRAAKNYYRHYSASPLRWSSLDPAPFPLQDQGFCVEDFLLQRVWESACDLWMKCASLLVGWDTACFSVRFSFMFCYCCLLCSVHRVSSLFIFM